MPSTTRRALDRFFGWLSRLVLAIFFRRVEVVGRDHLPEGGPLLLVANHVNGLVDPLFVLGSLGVPARMLGKSTLWRIPVLAQLLDFAGVIPVYRRTDAGVDPTKNAETFARCHEELARGGAIALFPEGTSHDDPKLKPLKTGAARIALEAERRFGPLGVRIVPVGLVFEQRERFRSRALVVVGEPLALAPELAFAHEDEPAAVRALTARIAEALERVTLNYETWEQARLVELGADVWDRDTEERPRSGRLASEFFVRRALTDGLERLQQTHPEEVRRAGDAARDYERLLRTTGLKDEQVVAHYRFGPAASFALRTLLRLTIASPVALLGMLLNLLPWLAIKTIALRFRDEPNQVATYKVFPSLLIYPATWAAEAAAAGAWLGPLAGAAIALSAPLSGWVALRWNERRAVLWRESRALLLLRRRRKVAEELRARRSEVEQEIERLVERWRALQSAPGAGFREPGDPGDPSEASSRS